MTFANSLATGYFSKPRGWIGFVKGAVERLSAFDQGMEALAYQRGELGSTIPAPAPTVESSTDRRADDLRRVVFDDLRNSGTWDFPYADYDSFADRHPNGKLLRGVIDRIIIDKGIDRAAGLVGSFGVSGTLGIPPALYDQMADVVAAARTLRVDRASPLSNSASERLEAAKGVVLMAAERWIGNKTRALAGSAGPGEVDQRSTARAYGLADGGLERSVRSAVEPMVNANALTAQEAGQLVDHALNGERRQHASSRRRLDLDRVVGVANVYTDGLRDGRAWLLSEKARYESFVDPEMLYGTKALLAGMLESLNSVLDPGKAAGEQKTTREARINQALKFALPADTTVIKRWQKSVDGAIKALDKAPLSGSPERLTMAATALTEASRAFTFGPKHVGETLSKQAEAMKRLAAIEEATGLHAFAAIDELGHRGKHNGGYITLRPGQGSEKPSLLALRTQTYGDIDKALRTTADTDIQLMEDRDLVAIIDRGLRPVVEAFRGSAFGTNAEPLLEVLKRCGLGVGGEAEKRHGITR